MVGSDHQIVQTMGRVVTGKLHSNRYWWLPGAIGLVTLFILVGAPLIALLQHIDVSVLSEPFTNPWLRRVIVFSFYQAFLSTFISLTIAIPVASALARRSSFPGRTSLLNLFSLALIIPTIVAVFGIVAVYGKTGWLNNLFEGLGLDLRLSIYGLTGILLAHVFFNMPLATRVFLQALSHIPENNWKLAAQLGMNRKDQFALLEWPVIKRSLPGVALLVFTLCFTSFAIVMTLGGGPRATTIEVAIYQALRFDFELGTAVSLALVQMLFCVSLMLLTLVYHQDLIWSARQPSHSKRFDRDTRLHVAVDYSVIMLAFAFVLLPMAAMVVAALNPSFIAVLLSPLTLAALLNTIWVACLSGLLSLLLGCLLLGTSRHLVFQLAKNRSGRLLEICGMAILVLPPIVLGTGMFLLLKPYADVFSLALVLVVFINALMGLPFVLKILSEPVMQVARNYNRLSASLGISGLNRLRIVEWPQLRKPIALGLSVATALSAGDLTAIALFGSERVATLPLLLYQRMGSYRMYDAAATALVLLLVCLLLFWCIERLVGGRDRASP